MADWVDHINALSRSSDSAEELRFWREFKRNLIQANSGFRNPRPGYAAWFYKYGWMFTSGVLTSAAGIMAVAETYREKFHPEKETVTDGPEVTESDRIRRFKKHFEKTMPKTRAITGTEKLLKDIKGQLANHGKITQHGAIKGQTMVQKLSELVDLSDPGIWQTYRSTSNNVYVSVFNRATYYEQSMLVSLVFQNHMQSRYKQIGASAVESPNLKSETAGVEDFRNIICECFETSIFTFKNNYAYEVNLLVYEIVPKSDLTSSYDPLTVHDKGIDDLYHTTPSGFNNSTVHYPEHSLEFMNHWYITKKFSIRLLPGEVSTFTSKAHGFYNHSFDRDFTYLKGKSKCLFFRLTGGIGHNIAETAAGYTDCKVDMLRKNIETFRFYNAGKQLKYSYLSEGYGMNPDLSAIQNEAVLETDEKIDG